LGRFWIIRGFSLCSSPSHPSRASIRSDVHRLSSTAIAGYLRIWNHLTPKCGPTNMRTRISNQPSSSSTQSILRPTYPTALTFSLQLAEVWSSINCYLLAFLWPTHGCESRPCSGSKDLSPFSAPRIQNICNGLALSSQGLLLCRAGFLNCYLHAGCRVTSK
jgi:hypothetical protein